MSGLRQIYEVAKRDFVQRAKSKAFLISLVVIVGGLAAVGPLIATEAQPPEPYQVGVVGSISPAVQTTMSQLAAQLDRDVEVRTYASRDEMVEALEDGSLSVGVDGREYVWREEANGQLESILTASFAQAARTELAAELGLTPSDTASLIQPITTTSTFLDPPEEDRVVRFIAAYFGMFLLYIAIIMFGQFVMVGVMEEKASRVVEVVLSRVRAHQLLAGKVIGIGLLGLIELVVVGGTAYAVISLVDLPVPDLPAIGLGVVLNSVWWFILGFGFYSVLYAALGATVSRQEDIQGVAFIPLVFLLPAYLIAMIAIESTSPVIEVLAMLPPFAPLVLPVRMALGLAPWWHVAIGAVGVIIATLVMIRFAGRIYEGSLLRLGAKVKLRDAWRASKQPTPA